MMTRHAAAGRRGLTGAAARLVPMNLEVITGNPLLAVIVAGEVGPDRPPKRGPQRVRYEWQQWPKFALAWAIACGLILAMLAQPARSGGPR